MDRDIDSARWARLKEIFGPATELPPSERASFVEAECGDDAELRDEIMELLRFSEKTSPFD